MNKIGTKWESGQETHLHTPKKIRLESPSQSLICRYPTPDNVNVYGGITAWWAHEDQETIISLSSLAIGLLPRGIFIFVPCLQIEVKNQSARLCRMLNELLILITISFSFSWISKWNSKLFVDLNILQKN